MAISKTQSIIPTQLTYRVKILAPSTTRNYQRKKILGQQIKTDAYKRFKKYEVSKITIDPIVNSKLQKYGKFTIPKYFNFVAKFIKEDTTRVLLTMTS